MSARRSTIARTLAPLALVLAVAACGGTALPEAKAPTPPTQHFVTRPDLRPPPVHIVTAAHGTAPGYIFIAPKKEVDQAGPMILDDAGNVVYFRPLDTHGVTDFRAQRYRGRPGPHLVARRDGEGNRERALRHRRQLVQRDHERHRRERPLRGHPRVHHHAAEHRVVHRVPPRRRPTSRRSAAPRTARSRKPSCRRSTSRPAASCSSGTAPRTSPWTSRTKSPRTTPRSPSTTSTSTRSSPTATGRC